jgi:hypothetical protein
MTIQFTHLISYFSFLRFKNPFLNILTTDTKVRGAAVAQHESEEKINTNQKIPAFQ